MADNSFKIEKSLSLKPLAAPPNNPINGDMYYDSTIPALRCYFDGVWVNIDDAGITLVGALDGEPKTADGGFVNHGQMFLQTADDTYPGVVSVGTQDFAGAKTFLNDVTFEGVTNFDGQLLFGDGTQLAPSVAFTNSPETGLYSPVLDQLAISVDNTTVATFTSTEMTVSSTATFEASATFDTGITLSGQSLAANGSKTLPAYSFTNSPDTGLHSPAPNQMRVSVNDTDVATFLSTGVSVTGTLGATGSLQGASLSVGAGSISGGAITGTSLDLGANGDITCDNITCDQIDTTGNNILTNGGNLTMGTGDITCDTITTTGNIAAISGTDQYVQADKFTTGSILNRIAWTVFTGTISGTTTINLTPGGNVLGATGYSRHNASETWTVISNDTGSNNIKFATSASNTNGTYVELENVSGADYNYRVVVFYL